MVWLLGKRNRYFKLTKKKMGSGDIRKESREQLSDVQKFWRENYKGKVKFIAISDADMSIVKKKFVSNVLRYGYDTVLYDTFKIQDGDFQGQRQDLSLVKIAVNWIKWQKNTALSCWHPSNWQNI